MISKQTIQDLVGKTEPNEFNISITMPTHKTGEEVQQDPIRFKNLLKNVEEELESKGMKEDEIKELLKKPSQILDDLHFWNHADEGLAVYMNRSSYELYKLPYPLQERTYINNQFLITPLLPMISLSGTYKILAVSQKNIRMLHCRRDYAADVTPDDIFRSIEEFIEEKPEVQIQLHTGSSREEGMFFGHGGSEEDKKVIVHKYLRGVEESVTRQLNQTMEPMILAGTEEMVSMYRSINKYQRVLDKAILGFPGEMKDKELQEAGWEIIKEHFLSEMYNAIDQFKEQNSERVSNNLSDIVESTVMGKTDTLFIAMNETNWGYYDENNHTVHFAGSSSNGREGKKQELLNWTALKAFEQGGKVFVLPKKEMPHATTIAALFRF